MDLLITFLSAIGGAVIMQCAISLLGLRKAFILWVIIAGSAWAFYAYAQDADGGSSDSVSPDGPDSTVTVSDYGG